MLIGSASSISFSFPFPLTFPLPFPAFADDLRVVRAMLRLLRQLCKERRRS